VLANPVKATHFVLGTMALLSAKASSVADASPPLTFLLSPAVLMYATNKVYTWGNKEDVAVYRHFTWSYFTSPLEIRHI